MTGVRQKPPELLHFRRAGRGRGVAAGTRPPGWRAPALPAAVSEPLDDRLQAVHQPAAVTHAREAWRRWWRSSAALGADPESDLEALGWWVVCVYRRALYLRVVARRPLVKGSMGQLVANPLEGVIGRLSADIARVEERFGMSTQDRFRLHIEPPRQDARKEERERQESMAMYRRMLEESER